MSNFTQANQCATLEESFHTLRFEPASVASQKSSGYRLSEATATTSITEHPGTLASDITVTSAGANISSDSRRMAMGPKPIYPVSEQRLRELRKGPTINIFVGKRPNLDLVFPISKSLLAYFSPTLRRSLKSSGGKEIVVLQNMNKKAVSWLLRWMLNGGREMTYIDKPTLDDPTVCLLNRLQAVALLGVQGWLEQSLTTELAATILKGAVTIKQLAWIYTTSAPRTVQALGKHLALTMIDAILDGTMTTCITSASSNPTFVTEVAAALRTRKGRLYKMQNIDWVPLTTFQIQFIYTFTAKDSDIRKMIAGHLLKLMDHGYVSNLDSYKQLAWKIDDFEIDMSKAIEEKEKWHAEQKKAGPSMRRQNKRSGNNKTVEYLLWGAGEGLARRSSIRSVAIESNNC